MGCRMELYKFLKQQKKPHASLRLRRAIAKEGQETQYVTLAQYTSVQHHQSRNIHLQYNVPLPYRRLLFILSLRSHH